MSDEPQSGVSKAPIVLGALLVAGAAAAAFLWDDVTGDEPPPLTTPAPTHSHTATPTPPTSGDPTYSNVYQHDYVGPDACRDCHAAIHARWQSHPHARMNQNANASTVVAAFDGRSLRYGTATVTFEQTGGDYVMAIRGDDTPARRYRVTRTVGSRFIQMFIGLPLDGPEPPTDPIYRREVKLPFAYWIARDEWFPQTYDETPDVPEYEDGKLTAFYDVTDAPERGEWRRSCALCHNTYPYAVRITELGQGLLLGFPKEDVARVGDHRPTQDERGAAILSSWQLVTLGISCESCHFGAREHALERSQISFVPRGENIVFARADDPALTQHPRQSPYVINAICGQCHRAQTQGPTYPDGGASWNSGEARDLAASACANAIKCTDCHDPHVAGPQVNAPPDDPKHLAACTGCHEAFTDEKAAADHSRHTAASCLDCHMPRIVHGLNGMVRTHRIGSPSHPAMLGSEQPNACNLCHLDQPLSWTLTELKKGWNVDITLPETSDASMGTPLGKRWLSHAEGVVRQVAADAYARSPVTSMDRATRLAAILPLLQDDDPPTRMVARSAVEHVLGRRLTLEEYRPWAAPKDRATQVEALHSHDPPQN
ncbi:MAG TPA: hypothetical protein ENK57_00910 [Polyangiaceae bacterium]|nr:hypothetical protein [Polyangiaceae bacterium]